MRRMKMQTTNIGMMLNKHGWDTEVFDLSANLDRTLTYHENKRNIAKMTGIQLGMDSGSRFIGEREQNRSAMKKFRSDPLYQVGFSNEIIDRRFQAMPPGKRFSQRSQKRYYERRENRSDRGYLL